MQAMNNPKTQLVLDGTKLMYHLDHVNRWNQGKDIFPIYVEISPVGYCNQSCLFCAYEYLSKKPMMLEYSRMRRLLREFIKLGVKSVFYSGEGEPLLHPDIVSLIRYSRSLGLDCALNTNGVLFRKEVSWQILKDLSWVRFSINAGNSKSYRKIHRAKDNDFEQLLVNLEDAVRLKRQQKLEVSLGVQLVYIKQPYSEIEKLAVTLRKIGLDYFTVKQFNKHPLSSFNVSITQKDIERIKGIEGLGNKDFYVTARESFEQPLVLRRYEKCYGFDFFAEIKCNGGVYPCGPLLGISRYCYGNIYKNTFKDIWLGPLRRKVVKDIHGKLDVQKCMPNCRLHHINDFLWRLKQVPQHVNFI